MKKKAKLTTIHWLIHRYSERFTIMFESERFQKILIYA